ncbi:unnamed protein product [Peronospora belbahrii]|uniref:Uncharacterized protein n=1 Tax=Peronospora belbahrii TaxID=622444 RepID=A0AAU9KLH7_9STRA|nr:unnamed protein product [Peronospora belbahrii]
MNTSRPNAPSYIHRSLRAQSNRISRTKDEDWRITRKLGSLLGDAEDVSARRKNLVSATLHRMWKVWLRPSKTRKLRSFASTTATSYRSCIQLQDLVPYRFRAHSLESGQQLRKVIGVRYPDTISNAKLYDRFKTEPLRFHLLRSGWSLFGPILGRPAGISAYRFMETFLNLRESGKWRGRRRLTLPIVLDADLQRLSAGHRFNVLQACSSFAYVLRTAQPGRT